MKFSVLATMLLAATVMIEPALALKVPACKRPYPSDVRDAMPAFSYFIKGNGNCNALSDIDGCQLFGNAEKRLPRAGRGQDYYEARVGEDRHGLAGKRRLVFLVTGTYQTAQARIVAKYFTPDHYTTFCSLN